MAEPGGRTVADALRRAEAGVAGHREAGMASLAGMLARLEALVAAREPGRERAVYDEAAALLDLAGFFDVGPLHEAAFALCDIADRMIVRDLWDWPAVEVHVRTLRLILSGDCRDTEATRQLLAGLAAIPGRILR